MRLRLRKVWVILAIFLCVIGIFGLRGIEKEKVNAGNVTDPTQPSESTSEEETTQPDASTGQYAIWFRVETDGDSGIEDFEGGYSTVKWNMKAPNSSGFQGVNGGKVTAILSIGGTQEAEMIGFDVVVWDVVVSTGASSGIDSENIIRTDLTLPNEKETSKIIGLRPVAAGLINLHITAQAYQRADDDPNAITLPDRDGKYIIRPTIYASRNIIIGNPLQIYKEPASNTLSYSYFRKTDENMDTTIYANNAQGSRVEWFYVDAEGEYVDITPNHILLNKPEDMNDPPRTSKIIDSIELKSNTPESVSGGEVKVYPYTVNLKDRDSGAGGFTKVIGRIYYNNDSSQDAYIESEYTIINKVLLKSGNDLVMKYGENKLLANLANDRGTLGWKSYIRETFTGYNKGTMEDKIVNISSNKITAGNYGDVTLQISPIWYVGDGVGQRWERFDSIIEEVADTINIHVDPDILKGKTSKSIIDNVEVISVGGSIPLSTNIVGDQYRYRWEYLQIGGDESGNDPKDWRNVTNIDPSETRFEVIESVLAGSRGPTSITIQGKTNGQVKMRCIVEDMTTGERILDGEEEAARFTIRIVDTMTLSETRKTIAVGGQFNIEAYISGISPDATVEWSVVDSDYRENIRITSTGATTATVEGVAETNGNYVACRAVVELSGTTTSATFYVMVVPSIDGARIEATPSNVISAGGSAQLDLILDTTGTTFTKDQIKWVLKNVVLPDGTELAADTIIRKEDSTSNILQSKVTGLAPGEAYVAVVTNDSAQTEIAVITIKVVSEVEGLRLNEHEVKGYLSSANNNQNTENTGSFVLVATPLPEGYTDSENLGIEWSAAPDDDTVTITPDPDNQLRATITYNRIGVVRVTANVAGLPATADFCMFTIENAADEIRLDPPGPYELRVGGTILVTPILVPEEVTDPTVTWTMENERIATVSRAGVITGVSPGTTFVTCTTSNGKSVQYPVTVLNPVERIELNYTELVVKKGTVFFLSANVLPENAADRTVTWSSSDDSICSVDALGTVTANATGECIIIATSNDDPTVYAECHVTVTESVAGITLNYREKTIKPEETFVLKATVLPSDANDRGVTFTSSNPAVATVTADGLVTGVAGGTTIIVVRTNDRGLIATCTVTVQQDITDITFDVTDIYLPKGENRKISYTLTPPNATIRDLEWLSSDPSIAFVDSEGYVHGVALGEVTITATAKDGTKVSATCKVTVINPVTEIRLSETSLIMMEGDEHTLTYTIFPQNATITNVTWTSSDVSVATVNSLGIVKALREGETRIRVSATDNSGVYAECVVVVIPYIPITSIRLNSTETTMILGESRQLTDRTYPHNTTERAEWRSSDTGVVTVDGEGNVRAVGPGTCTISKLGVTSGIEGTCIIHVIGLTATDITLEKYDTFDLYLDDPDTAIVWFSRDKRTATVSRNGLVTARRPGVTYIVADLNGKLVSCRVTVTDMNRSQQDTINAANNVAANNE